MAATTYVCSIAHVASRLGEDPELLEAIVSNDDNLTYGNIVSVHVGHDDYIRRGAGSSAPKSWMKRMSAAVLEEASAVAAPAISATMTSR